MPQDRNDSAELAVLKSSVGRIEEYMRMGSELRIKNAEKLARIDSACEGFTKYQDRCDTERREIDLRVDDIEKKYARSRGEAAGVSLVVSTIMGVAAIFIEAFKK